MYRSRIVFRDDAFDGRNAFEWAPPVRVISVVSLLACTLDLLADFLMCAKIAQHLDNFQSDTAFKAANGFFFFTGVSVLVYIMEMTDICLTLKNDFEDMVMARVAKSLVLALEEVPLPILLNIMYSQEPRMAIAATVNLGSWIKLVALLWGLVKFTKLRFLWCCLPLNPKHDLSENTRRCFQFTFYRIVMLIINFCHFAAIAIVIVNIVDSSKGGRPIFVRRD
uniref:Ion_trans domain-containing protein n=1 Tax=Rhabditophanes sp. KR3021 TaxID=114890 RepID=A0AC35TKR7_9BILA